MGQKRLDFLRELGPGGLSSLALALASALAGLGLPVAWRLPQVLRDASRDDRGPADAILVLGRELVGDQPTAVFRARLERGARLLSQGRAPRLIVSGGVTGVSAKSEAEAGRDYLLARGVPAAALLIEDRSRHTLENLFNVRATLRAHGWTRLVLVSDPLHLARAGALARGLGLETLLSPAAGAPPVRGSLAWMGRAVREAFLLHWYYVGMAYSRLLGSARLLGRVT